MGLDYCHDNTWRVYLRIKEGYRGHGTFIAAKGDTITQAADRAAAKLVEWLANYGAQQPLPIKAKARRALAKEEEDQILAAIGQAFGGRR